MKDVFVRETVLPYKIGGATIEDEDGDYNVYINRNQSEDKKRKALDHELEHIRRNHFADPRSVQEKEEEIKRRAPSAGTDRANYGQSHESEELVTLIL